ncbi:hypothetical protein M440DRAFT_1405612 [Trichoderma longibrachiatum ATCC 18648]|uniref:Uncharacterized protein n=1 Tax=Trichoderma longibrachiatum ATCC 18648 TaxID=983965 RepID=A0A2T4BSE2_TRILO|nr:hypothetical protein M440DRAFT_1405612 [Trichoderma longibrachiatum ATCC 18648]
MLENSKIYLHFLLVACLATPVTASWWDDFTNNLATDLTPLIALFGEQATKQFLSESTTFLDNFIFAMAPLGILTGVVSAIRVCGSPSLRAFIGRAQEGGGIAEAELCSSTSRDVCELYHNGAIVRVFGRPKILEIIHDPVLEANEVGNSAVSDDKREYGISISRHYFQRSILNDNRWQEKGLDASDDEAKSGQPSFKTMSNNFAPNPNLSLNIGIVKRSSYVYIMTAIFGFLAQGSVIVLAAVVKYTLKWKKNENTIDPWAFPFVLAGTICVCLGMYLCATLVNDSTKERVFERKDDLSSQNASPSPILYVVQPGNQVVGDQTFDPFLIFKPTNSYITSWKAPSSANSISETRSPTTSRRKMPSLRSMRRPSEEISVLIATLITTLGFALQFVGLRAMHSIVSLLQLAVTIAMSFVRALLRTQRLKIEANILRDRPDEVSSHELDWLALQIGKDAGQPRCSWGVVTQVPSDAPRQAADDKAWEYRCRLAKLTEQPANGNSKLSNAWGNDLVSGRLQAQQLKKAIEDSMSIFIAHAKTKGDLGSMETIPWILNVAVGKVGKTHDQAPTYQSIDIPLRKQGSLWTVDQSLLEAVIGLWSWSIISDPLTEGETFGFKTSTASDIPIYRAVAAGAESEVQQAWTEIQFWIGEPNVTLSSFAMENPSSNKANAATIWKHRKDGEQMALDDVDSIKTGSLFGRSDPYQRIFGWHGINILKPFTVGAIRIGLKHIPTLCAQDIYQSFLCSIAAYFELENATTTVKREENTMRLEHQLVTQLMACFEASGIGSKQDASLIIIPALQNNALLPRATQAAPTAYRLAETLRRASSFREAEKVLRWAWGMVSGSGELEETAMTELGELYRYALFSKSWHDLGKHGIEWMRSQRNPSMSGLADEVIDRYVSLEKRPRESRTGQHVLDAIIRRQREEALWSISQLEKGDDFPIDEKSGRTVLSLLSQEGWLELVRTVLQIGSVVDSVDSNGRTPLSYAAEHGHLPVVAILMEANALPITEDSSRRTPLSYAAGEGHVSVVEKLLRDPRVNIYSKDMENRSPLHWAATNGCHDAIRYLVNQGAQVDLMDSNHHTPLYAALSNNRRHKVDRWETADLLVELESKTDFMIQGKEAFEWALECGDFTCAEFLWERREAERNIEIVINVEVDGVIWRHMDLSTSSSQVDIKTKLFDHEHNEKEVTMEDVILVAKKGCRMAIHYSLNGLPQKNVICKAGHKIISTLLDSLQGKANVEKLFVAAASNEENGEAITAAIFDHWQTHVQTPIQITNRLAEALCSGRNGNRIMGVLLQQRQEHVRITEAVVPIVTRLCHVDVIALLLSHLGGRLEVTEGVTKAILDNDWASNIMMLLLNQSREKIPITEAAACLIVRYFDASVVGLLLSRYRENAVVPEDVVNAAAANREDGTGVMALLLDQRGLQFQVTERTLEAATANPNGRDIVELLLNERGAEVQVTEAIVRSALTSEDGCRGIMKLLFDRRGDQIHITEETLQLAIRKNAGKEVIELLLDSLGEGFQMSEEVMRLALFKSAEKDVIEFLLERHGNKLQITEEFFESAELYLCDRSMIELLLDRLGDQFQITEGIVQLAAAGRQAPHVLDLLLDRRGDQIQITERVLRAAAGNELFALDVMQLLLDRRGQQVQITEEVLKAAIGIEGYSYKVMNLLLDRRGEQVQITEGVLLAAVGSHAPLIVRLLLDRLGEQVQITEEVVKAAAGNCEVVVELLLDRLGEQVQVTEEVLKAAAGNECAAHKILKLLLERRRHLVRITEEVVTAAAGNRYWARELFELLLDECGDQVYVTDSVVKAIVDNEGVNREELIEFLLDRLGEEFQATEKMMEALPAEWTVSRQSISDILEHQKEKKQA